jgi:hypothetical protein
VIFAALEDGLAIVSPILFTLVFFKLIGLIVHVPGHSPMWAGYFKKGSPHRIT